jgi:cytochrome c553
MPRDRRTPRGRVDRAGAGRRSEADTVQQLLAFKAGSRPATVMTQLAKGYSDEQIRQLAAYFAAQR